MPIARGFGRLGLTPNHLTLIGFGIAIVAAWAAASQAWLAAGVLVLIGGVFDRWGEGVVYVGIAWGFASAGMVDGAVVAAAAMTSAFMVSYARAKSENLGFAPGTGMANVGVAPREVRIVLLTIGLVLAGLFGGVEPACDAGFGGCAPFWERRGDGSFSLGMFLGLITILATITTIQRILHVRAQAREG